MSIIKMAEGLLADVQHLVAENSALRADNDALQADIAEVGDVFEEVKLLHNGVARLKIENDALREALEKIANHHWGTWTEDKLVQFAKAALSPSRRKDNRI